MLTRVFRCFLSGSKKAAIAPVAARNIIILPPMPPRARRALHTIDNPLSTTVLVPKPTQCFYPTATSEPVTLLGLRLWCMTGLIH
jgi:hypothetical protein